MCSFSFVVSVLNSSYFISSQYQMNLTPDLLSVSLRAPCSLQSQQV